jgi:hypothetical protein
MDSTPNLKQADPGDVLTVRAEQALTQIYDQFTRADKQPSQPEHEAALHPSDPQISVDTVHAGTSRDGRARRGIVGLLLAAVIGVAAIASQSSYWDPTKLIVVRWVRQLVPTSQLPEKSELPEQPGPSTVRTGTAEPTPMQPPTPVETKDVATAAAPMPPELAQSLQTIIRGLADVEQGIEQLKASQAQIVRDNAQIAEQVKASQEQITSMVAKGSGHDPRPKASASPAQPSAISTSKPARTPPLPQGTTRPQAPSQLGAGKP